MRIKKYLILLILIIPLSIAFAAWEGIIWPAPTGGNVQGKDSLTVDMSDAADGYIYCKGATSSKRYKLRIEKDGTTLTYDLNTDGNYELFPLQLGSGSYKVNLYRNTSGKKYTTAGEISFNVDLKREDAAFLVPSLFVNYNENTGAVAISEELCAGLETDREKFEAIRKWMKKRFVYDYIKAVTVESGTMPDIDGTIETQMGICQDFAAIAACMLRVQGIPTQMAIGYRNNEYHAWNYVFLDGDYELYDPTMEINQVTKKGKYSLERFY